MVIRDGGDIAATGSLCGDVIKYFAADFEHRGTGTSGAVLTEIKKYAFAKGTERLFLVTKPENRPLFEGLLFKSVVGSSSAVLMESPAGGIEHFLSTAKRPSTDPVGAIVMNANPFTKGHRFLVEKASAECGRVYVFVLAEEKSEFSASERLEAVRRGTADLENVTVLSGEKYLVSAATFPAYFLKNKSAEEAFCELDIAVFAKRIAPALGITRRYVGTEPFSEVTAAYNAAMAKELPKYGCELVVVPRLEHGGTPISASEVRRLLAEGKHAEAAKLRFTTE